MLKQELFNEGQLEHLDEVKYCYSEEEMELIANPNYTVRQMELMEMAIDNGYDTKSMLNKSVLEMRYTIKGFENNVNIEPYMGKGYVCPEFRIILNCLKSGTNPKPYIGKGYNKNQLLIILSCIDKGVNPEYYIDKVTDYDSYKEVEQEVINDRYKEFEEKIKLSECGEKFIIGNIRKFNFNQLNEIVNGINDNIDISKYAYDDVESINMKVIRKYLNRGIDISEYRDKLDYKYLDLLGECTENNIDITPYIFHSYEELTKYVEILKLGYSPELFSERLEIDALEQIILGLKDNLEVEFYRYCRTAENVKKVRLKLLELSKEGYDVYNGCADKLTHSQYEKIIDILNGME